MKFLKLDEILLIMIFSISVLTSAQSQTIQSLDIEIVENYLEAAFSKNYEAQKSLMHPNIIDYHPTVLEKPANGKNTLIQGWKDTVKSMDSVRYTSHGIGGLAIKEGEHKGNWIVTIGEVTSYFKGNKTPINSQMVGMYRIDNGLIKEVRNYGNLLDIYLQLGFTLQPSKTN